MALIEIPAPTTGVALIYADAEAGQVIILDQISAANLATTANRRQLRLMLALVQEGLDNVRDALERTTGKDVTS